MSETTPGVAPGQSNVVADMLSAVAVNVGAFVVGYPLAIVAPKLLIFVLPFGMFWAYVMLVAWYAFVQFRKGRRLRAALAVSLAAVVLIVLATNLRIA